MKAADIIARRLHAQGCRYAFGIPGGEVLTLMQALSRAGLRFVLTKHENTAGFMAEGTYHATGAPAVLLATIGPGVANAVNVVANAFQDRVPLIFLTGCVDDRASLTYTHQVFDHQALLRPVTKGSFRVAADTADIVIEKALALALEGRPGPVHIDVPIGVAAAEVPEPTAMRWVPVAPSAPAPGPELAQARALIERARRPLMVVGLDVRSQRADEAVGRLARDCGIPVITTYKAKGLIDEDHELCLGGAGLSPAADRILLPLVEEADVILAVGYDPIEMRANWCNPWEPAKVIDLAAVSDPHFVHGAAHRFAGDISAGLTALLGGIAPKAPWPDGAPAAARAALAAHFASGGSWGPSRIVEVLRHHLPPDIVTTADSGAHRILISQAWRCRRPGGMLQSSALCTMGCAPALAAGYSLATERRPTVAFVGDAGLEMVLGELATLRDLGLPVIIIVLVDESLNLIEMKQRAGGLPELGVRFGGTDFAAVATALGGYGVTVADETALAEEIAPALVRDRFTLIACRIDRGAYEGLL